MAYNCIKLSDGTEACLDDQTGYLHFTGKDFYKYHHIASDVRDILALLLAFDEDINKAAEKEQQAALKRRGQLGIQEQAVVRETASVEVGRLPSKKKDETEEEATGVEIGKVE